MTSTPSISDDLRYRLFALATYCDIDFLILALYLNSPRSDNPNVFLVVVHNIG
ncbi:hypothetical protein DFH09DRAFT_1352600 [Mycena vulgaris]|nr:hypothetical protein DFH09DRAFT_1352600 [Mycena vulgaris]